MCVYLTLHDSYVHAQLIAFQMNLKTLLVFAKLYLCVKVCIWGLLLCCIVLKICTPTILVAW